MTVTTLPNRPVSRARTVCQLPARHTEPPYDDERSLAPAVGDTQGALALAFGASDELPALRLVSPLPTSGHRLPPARVWASRLLQALLEVLGGERSAAQLVRWTSEPVYTQLARDAGPRNQRCARTAIRSVHVMTTTEVVVEVCAVVQHGSRHRAIALRLDAVDGRWLCTALQVG